MPGNLLSEGSGCGVATPDRGVSLSFASSSLLLKQISKSHDQLRIVQKIAIGEYSAEIQMSRTNEEKEMAKVLAENAQ
tara:strand:+ start:368 stop:601 length:234 start_codon:yes stop_codon:yes gene_type:complete